LAASGQLSLVTDIQPFNPNQFHEPRPQLGLAKTQPPIDVVPTTTRGELRMPVLTRSLKTEMCYLYPSAFPCYSCYPLTRYISQQIFKYRINSSIFEALGCSILFCPFSLNRSSD
jgi:hypothetical protein